MTDCWAGRISSSWLCVYTVVRGPSCDSRSRCSAAGLLTIAKTLDREATDLFQLRVVARDQGAPRQTTYMDLTVHVVDVNDNRPSFAQRVYQTQVYENRPADTPLLTLIATDDDIGTCA